MSTKKDDCGIYCIKCIVNNKYYVGSSYSINGRKMWHFKDLKRGSNSNAYMQEEYNKFGEDNFIFLVLEILDRDNNLLKDRENYWIEKLNAIYPNGYNYLRAGRPKNYESLSKSLKGREFIEEHKNNLSIAGKGKVFSEERKNNLKKNHADVSGTNNPRNKLSLEDCLNIKKLLSEKTNEKKMDKYRRIGDKFNVNESVIRKINNGTHWSCRQENKNND